MTWANFYLFCFLVGFLWSLVSLLLGSLHFHLPFTPHGDLHNVGLHAHAHVSSASSHGPHPAHAHGDNVSPFNFGSLAAFLAWFGGVGFLLTAYSRMWFVWGLCFAIGSGLVGAAIIYAFLSKVLTSREQDLNPTDYEMVGVLGHVSSPIRVGGTGEIVFSQEGVRRTCGARSEKECAISKGAEVVVTRYEKGIAYVRLWDELNQVSAEGAQ
jgi:membrane protein implicated in regulation of membrane protease activity